MKLRYYIVIFALLLPSYLAANSFNISGTIADASKKPIKDAVVKFEGQNKEVKTNEKGEFRISSKDSTALLVVSKKGFRAAKLKVAPYLNEHYYLILMELRNDESEDRLLSKGGRGKIADRADVEMSSASVMMRASAEGGDGVDIGTFHSTIEFDVKEGGDAKGKSQSEGRAGVLTAGEVNDFSKWNLWQDISEGELAVFVNEWKIKPAERFTLQIESQQHTPIVNANVKLLYNGITIWQARTDNTGKAELWANAYFEHKDLNSNFTIQAEYLGKTYTIEQAKRFHEGINFLKLNEKCNFTYNLDIAFVVDATGSMGDEIDYLKAELTDIIQKVKDSVSHLDIQLSSLFYRDLFDDYLTKHKDFTSDINNIVCLLINLS